MLSETHADAAKALERFLGHQSGHAQNIAAKLPQDVAAAIATHALHPTSAREAIKDELARLEDLRREGHARDAAAEMVHQQNVLAARIVIEREIGATPDQSLAAASIMTDGELAEVAALQADPHCRDQVLAINERSAQRIIAQNDRANEAADAAAAAAEQEAVEAAARAGTDELPVVGKPIKGEAPLRDK